MTDLLSFYTLPSSVLGNDKYSTLKAAFMYYTVPGATPLPQLMTDALILAHARSETCSWQGICCKQPAFSPVQLLLCVSVQALAQ